MVENVKKHNHLYWAWILLKYSYICMFIVVGLDKFFNYLVLWQEYLNPQLPEALHLTLSKASYFLGIINIAQAIIIYFYTQIGAYVAAVWLIVISINLISTHGYYDIAIRDIILAVGAGALGLLCNDTDRR